MPNLTFKAHTSVMVPMITNRGVLGSALLAMNSPYTRMTRPLRCGKKIRKAKPTNLPGNQPTIFKLDCIIVWFG
ncbi:hypothetical protein D1872_293070 [compost metagenome]